MMRPLHRTTQLAGLITISMAAVASPISAQEPPTAPKPYPRTATIVYDVRDLLLAPEPVVPDVELALWLEPTVSTDRRTVTLAVNPRLAELLVAGGVVEETEAQVAATLSIPDGHSMLLVLPLVRNRLVAVRTGPGAGGAADGRAAGDERVREIGRERVPDPALDEGVALVLLRADVVVIGADERE